ncbi:MAG: NADAR family protein [Chitinophagaceae bacterium]|nr:NADAR family protein [Chitinophagaceae bacterium]
MQPILTFQNTHRFLSNFWPCSIEWDGLLFPTLEHAYAASKTADDEIKRKIRSCPTPGEAKEYMAAHDLATDPGWTRDKKLGVMKALLALKFGGREPLLTRALLATGDAELIEGNDWNDTFWGVCNGAGENNLGKLLMELRQTLLGQKEQIEKHLPLVHTHEALAVAAGLSRLELYEKMIAFDISQRALLGYQ